MATLDIDYDPDSREAKLALADDIDAWRHIARICKEASDSARETKASTIRIPWWSFLVIRPAIAFHLRRSNIAVSVSQRAADLIAQSRSRIKERKSEKALAELSDEQIISALGELGFKRRLKPYQIRNVRKMIQSESAATFSVPGAGKTSEALAFYTLRKGQATRLLVICPKNAFAAWEEQVEDCFGSHALRVQRLTGPTANVSLLLDQRADLSLITYQKFANEIDLIGLHLATGDLMVFLDESHKIKRGTAGKIGASVLDIAHLARGRVIMSGTPMPNSLEDLVPQFQFLLPDTYIDEQNVRQLAHGTFVRTTKSELGLRRPIRSVIRVSMSEGQREIYRLVCSEIARQERNTLSRFDRHALRRIGQSALRLLQLVSNPALLAKGDFEYPTALAAVLDEGDSVKLKAVTERARDLAQQGHKIIVWSSFRGNVELLANRLIDFGADYIHGSVEAGSEDEEDTREFKIKRFHDDPGCKILVANPAACGEGISLHTVCHHAIYLDRNYNAAQYMQSEDRIHRIGLPENQDTFVEIFSCSDSVDERVNDRLVAKIARMLTVLEDPDIQVEPVTIELDEQGVSEDDAKDFLEHVIEYVS